jgi:hypothetical protein
MKRIVFLVIAIVFTASVSSCGSTAVIKKNNDEVAGYTLKNKKELMEQKVLNKKVKTVVALP